ncbi:ABC transporter [Rhodococcus rhodnii]|uniref:ABC transporter n=1 Tax=Rhodococcus rhodnii TaxID=38312 RepID=UPI001EE73F90|nr:ABC transporter [Rhodococcus rhodnii]
MVVAVSLAGTACGSNDGEAAGGDEAGTARAGSDLAADPGSTEVEGPQPRLVVTDRDSGAVSILDLATTDELARFDYEGAGAASIVNGRYVFSVDQQAGEVHVVDAGSWTIDHGDHTHSYVRDPVELGTLTGTKPAHVTTGDRRAAVFFDDDGRSDLVDVADLRDGELSPREIPARAPHHGVVLPVAGHVLVSTPSEDPDDNRPNGFEVYSADGDDATLDAACPRMHGATVVGTTAIGACDDGLLLVSAQGEEWSAEKLPYPEGITPESRPASLYGHDRLPLVVGTAGAPASNDGVVVLDVANRSWTHIRTPEPALAAELSGDGTTVFAVLADGTFATFDAATGASAASSPVLERPFDWSDTSATRPAIAVGGSRVYVSDPEAGTVAEIDYRDDARVARTFDLGGTISSVGVVGS